MEMFMVLVYIYMVMLISRFPRQELIIETTGETMFIETHGLLINNTVTLGEIGLRVNSNNMSPFIVRDATGYVLE